MALCILIIIATWFIYNGSVAHGLNLLPLPVAVLITIFASIEIMWKIARVIYKTYQDRQKKNNRGPWVR